MWWGDVHEVVGAGVDRLQRRRRLVLGRVDSVVPPAAARRLGGAAPAQVVEAVHRARRRDRRLPARLGVEVLA